MENVVISKNIKKIVGVYAIWNLENQKVYIGSSKNIKSRVYNHLTKLRNGKHENVELQKDFDDGNKFIIFKVLEAENIKNLRYYEYISIIHFDAISNGYNTQSVIEHEPREVTEIRFLAGSLDFYNKWADDEDKGDIINKVLNN